MDPDVGGGFAGVASYTIEYNNTGGEIIVCELDEKNTTFVDLLSNTLYNVSVLAREDKFGRPGSSLVDSAITCKPIAKNKIQ